MVKLRMTRAGAKKAPYYHVIATDGRAKRDGKNIETIGAYDPTVNPPKIEINLERAKYWLGVGAQASQTVASLIKKAEAAAAKA